MQEMVQCARRALGRMGTGAAINGVWQAGIRLGFGAGIWWCSSAGGDRRSCKADLQPREIEGSGA
jgi:hypothetical protein